MKLNKIIRSVCDIAADDIGKVKADKIEKNAQKRLEELCAENSNDSKALKAHTYKRIYPCIAVYETLLAEGIEQEKAVWYIREYFQRLAKKLEPHLQRIIKLFKLEKKMPKLFLKIIQKSFGTDAGFIYEFPECCGNEARFNMVRCPYFDTCKRYGCSEITMAFCDGDDAGYGNLNPKLFWGRTKTIGHGDDCCDFWLKFRE